MISIQDQINYCKKKMAAGGSEFKMYRSILDTLLLADKWDLVPSEISGEDYQKFVGAYFDFRRERGGEARMSPAAGKALKDIIRYLLKLGKAKEFPDDAAEHALNSWKYILDKWNFLSDYIKGQVGLIQINKHIEEIIEQLTHASKKARNSHNQSEKERLEQAIKSRK